MRIVMLKLRFGGSRDPRRHLVDGRRRRLRGRWRAVLVVVTPGGRWLVGGQLAPGTRIQYVHEHGHDHENHGDGKAAALAATHALLLLLLRTSADCERIID